MSGGRPRTAIGTYGAVYVMSTGDRCVAETRYRDLDGRLRKVSATADSPATARALLKQRLVNRTGYGSGGQLSVASPFRDLVALWLADLELRDLALGTKESYQDNVRLHVLPAFEHFTLGEITTGRVEWFLKSEAAVSHSRAMHSRTLLNLLFGFALRHDAIVRNPVEGASQIRKPKTTPQALTAAQIAAIRRAAAEWRSGEGLPGPKSDGQVRDLIEVLLGTGMRAGEALALGPCDVTDGPGGMVVRVTGTVVNRKATGVIRQPHPKSESSIRSIPVPDFAAEMLRRCGARSTPPPSALSSPTAPAARSPRTTHAPSATWSCSPALPTAASPCTGSAVPRPPSSPAAWATGPRRRSWAPPRRRSPRQGHYIAPDPTIDHTPAAHLERTLRATDPDAALLATRPRPGEDAQLAALAAADDDTDQVGA